jgi:ATP-dependent Clp protease adaptor protein ClpS
MLAEKRMGIVSRQIRITMGEGDKRPDQHEDDGPQIGVVEKTRTRTKRPSMYRVLLLNDDYTPMEFVVDILEQIFHKSRDEAVAVMLNVHQSGVGVCGVYSFDIAETKVAQVAAIAREHEHPLQCTMEKA